MIKITSNHLAELFQSIFQDVRIRLGAHAIKCFRSPSGNFGLHEDAVAVTVIQNALVLGPMDTRQDAVQMLHIRMVVGDPLGRLCHAEFRIASGHAFHAHQSHALAVEVKRALANLKLSYAESRREVVYIAFSRDGKLETVQMGMVKVPE